MNKNKLHNVTLVAVSSIKVNQTVKALLRSSKYIDFSQILLISHKKPIFLSKKITYIYCDKITSSDQYSHFMIYKLADYIHTSHALVIQYDGYILNHKSWTNDFLKYDYIGAPWPDTFLDPAGVSRRVGNGGFSLRSKKLLQIANDKKIPFKPLCSNSLNEDLLIAVDYHDIFENAGCKFAPIELAAKFSHEIDLPELLGIKPFGFHGYYNQKALSDKQRKQIENDKFSILEMINLKQIKMLKKVKRFFIAHLTLKSQSQ